MDNYLTGKLGGVADNATVAKFAVVGNVHVLHEEIVVAYYCFAFAGCATTDGDVLTDTIVVANLAGGLFATELEILRFGTDTCPGEELISVADSRTGVDGDTVKEIIIVTYYSVLVDLAEWPDDVVVAKFCLGLDKGHRTYCVHNY